MNPAKESAAMQKSKAFAIRTVKLYNYLCEEKREYVMSKQLLRAGTSIGANLAEARCAVSKKEFLTKISISFKECSETAYWLELLHETNYITDFQYNSMYADCNELYRIRSATVSTLREKLKH